MSLILETLLGSRVRARLLRFFLQNPEQEFPAPDIVRKNLVSKDQARKELKLLSGVKFIIERTKKGKKWYLLNINFPFYPELRNLIIKANIYPQCQSLGKIKNIGDVKLALVSGSFLNYPRSKVDLLIVANLVNRSKLNNLIKSLEAEIGKELVYVLMNNEEFQYRLNMMDRFILEFLEGPHDEIINRLPKLKRFINGLRK